MRPPARSPRLRRALRLGLWSALVWPTVAVSSLIWAPAAAHAAIPVMSRGEIVARAESAIGTDYTWGRESWTANASGPGPDCSGFVLKCWEVPRSMLYQEEDGSNAIITPRYTTYDFKNLLGPWSGLPTGTTLEPGDALVRNDGSSGHIVLYAQGDAWNYPVVYEAPSTGSTVRRASRYLTSDYRAVRRASLSGGGSLLLDNPTAKTTGGSDVGGAWTRSTSVAGYYQADYQTHPATTQTAWARWTPRFSSSGYHTVYLRWTSSSNRASNARVTINTPAGQLSTTVDQRFGNGAWVKIGRYYFQAGYSTGSGSVAIHATGANGHVVADAALFAP